MKQVFYIVEVRWKADNDFQEIELFCGDLDGAKEFCVLYCREKRLPVEDRPSWLIGDDNNGPVYYMHVGPQASFRIRQ